MKMANSINKTGFSKRYRMAQQPVKVKVLGNWNLGATTWDRRWNKGLAARRGYLSIPTPPAYWSHSLET